MTSAARLLGRLLVLTSAVVIIFSVLITPFVKAADFSPNNIIDDSVFDNSTSMSADAIDSWLNNNFPNSCISPNSGFQAKLPTGYSPGGGFTYGGFVSAGNVIATAAQTYGINPQVLLVTLQKEQSLVAGGVSYCNNGDEHKYAAATGYGCPDGGTVYSWTGVSLYRRSGVEHTATGSTCVNTAAKAGFSQQVIRAAWLLKFGQQRSLGNTTWAVISGSWDNSDDPPTCYGGPMTQGQRKRCNSDSSTVFYDGYTTIDGTSTHIDTGATAALYWYTPHFHGNQNFFDLYTAWFGSTYGGTIGPISYRLYNTRTGDHHFTAKQNERMSDKQNGYKDDGLGFVTTPTQSAGMVPVYAHYNGRVVDHWLSVDGMNHFWALVYGGYRDDGVATYAYPTNPDGSPTPCSQGTPIYALWHGGNSDHFYTSSQLDRYWALIYGGYVDDRSAPYHDPNGMVAFCGP